MAFTRRQIWTSASTVWLLVLTALAAYSLHTSNDLSLPVPNILSALAVALPPLAGLALETSLSMTTTRRTKSSAHVRPYVLQLVGTLFLIYETVLASLAGTHLSPAGSLSCALRERWLELYRDKDASSIRRIQDRFECCGLASTKDMPWPFPEANAGHDVDTCRASYGRELACLEPWRNAERRVAGVLLAVALGVFVWQIVFLYIGPEESPSWLPSTLRLPHDDITAGRGTQRQIEYRDEEEPREEESVAGEVRTLNAQSQLASHVEGSRNRAAVREEEDNAWR